MKNESDSELFQVNLFQKLEKQMKNIEAHCEKLEKEYRSATVATQTTISIANEANFKCNESGNATTINSVLGETASMMKVILITSNNFVSS